MGLNYRAEIDGLRAIAVVAVILYHAGFSYAGGGFVGVDVFFVISGFLITSIIIEDLQAERFSIRRFYERRARRILPALVVVSALCLVPAWFWMFPEEFVAFGQSVVGVATFSANVVFWLKADYFSPDVGRMPLLHVWSLGVEEQYYFIVPLAISCAWAFGQRRHLSTAIGVIGVVSLALAEWGSRVHPSATFYLLHTRIWELMIGSWLAVRKHDQTLPAGHNWRANLFACLGLLLILYSIVAFNDKTTRFPSVLALIPTVGTMLVIRFGDPTTAIGRFLGAKQLVGIGLISYSLYLWHQPLFAFARIESGHELTAPMAWMLCAVALALAFVTWRYVEVPFRRKGPSGARLWIGSMVSLAVLLLAGVTFSNKQVAQRHFTMKQQEVLAWLQYSRQIEVYRAPECHIAAQQPAPYFQDSCISSGASRSGAIVVWGDSFAAAIHVGIFGFAGDRVRAQFTASACPPLIGFTFKPHPGCPDINRHALKKIRELPHANVFLSANWSVYAALPGFLESLAATVKLLEEMGANPIVLGQTPLWYPSLPEVLAQRYAKGDLLPSTVFSDQTQVLNGIDNQMETAANEAGAPFIRILPLLCDPEGCKALSLIDGKATPLVWDSGHFTKEGSEMVGRLVYPKVRDLLVP